MATRAEKAVVLAQDVLAQLKAGKLQAVVGEYLDPKIYNACDRQRGESLQTHLLPLRNCQVCALGALFVAKVIRHNRFTCDGEPDSHTLREAMAGYFTRQQLFDIETAFECCKMGTGRFAAKVFGRRYADDTDRLMAIMRNIIRNKGTFVIPQSCFSI